MAAIFKIKKSPFL